MAKKKETPKTDQLRQMREANAVQQEKQGNASFAEKLAELRAEARQQQAAAEARLAGTFVKDARKTLDEHIEASKDTVLHTLWTEWKEATRLIGGQTTTSAKSNGGTRLTKENKEALVAAATSVLEGAGKTGTSLAEFAEAMKLAGVDPHDKNGKIRNPTSLLGDKVKSNGSRGNAARYSLA